MVCGWGWGAGCVAGWVGEVGEGLWVGRNVSEYDMQRGGSPTSTKLLFIGIEENNNVHLTFTLQLALISIDKVDRGWREP